MSDVAFFAEKFRTAELERSVIEPIAKEIDHSLEIAYEIQETNVAFWRRDGREQVGWKIGLTSEAARAQMKATEPMLGALFADMEIAAGSAMSMDQLIEPRIEPEIAVVMKADLLGPEPSRSAILEAIELALPAFEIVDCRSQEWNITGIDAIADNALASRFVLGERQWSLNEQDLAKIEVAASVNETVAGTGSGANCMGHPLAAMQWLARILHDRGRHLSKGDLVLTGSLCPMIKISSGDTISAKFNQDTALTLQVR